MKKLFIAALLLLGGLPLSTRAASQTISLSISSNTQNYNAYSAAIAAGWNGINPINLTVTVAPGVVVGANSTGAYAFDTGSGYPAGSSISIINNGYIVGAGGAGGNGGQRLNYQCSGTAGGVGGPALHVGYNTAVTNNGVIGGGGGGGGGGGAKCTGLVKGNIYGGGGGGGAGNQPGGGGWQGYPYYPSSSGSLTSGGAGGEGPLQYSCASVGAGGSGGNLGSGGSTGGNSYLNTCAVDARGSPGGAAGSSVVVGASQCVVVTGSGSVVPSPSIPVCALGTVSVTQNLPGTYIITGPVTLSGSASGTTNYTNQPAGTYTITWGAISGYTTPASQTYSIVSNGATISFTGTYTANTCPNGAIDAPSPCTTCPSGKILSGGQCITPTVSVTASPSTYSMAGGTSNSFTFSATSNPANAWACRLLDYTQSPLTTYVNNNSSISYAVPTNAGTYSYYIGCENTANTSTTAVSNQITVTVLQPTTVTFSAAPSVLYGAGATTLTWSSNGSSCTSQSPSYFSTGGAANNTSPGVNVNVSSSGSPYSFAISCTGSGGTTQKSVAVVVNSAPSITLSLNQSVNQTLQSMVRAGQAATLSWGVTNMTADSCHISTVGTPWSATINNASNDSGSITSPP
ncbi:MAG TPA: hypothetical protein VF803_03705, partial [Candidatus Paceibacterota bacterium]